LRQAVDQGCPLHSIGSCRSALCGQHVSGDKFAHKHLLMPPKLSKEPMENLSS
jgi:hypothetical protein